MSDQNQPSPTDPSERLEAYLDGLLPLDERQQFEQQIANDPQLAREVELQSKVDNSLGRLFVSPPAPIDILTVADHDVSEGSAVELPEHERAKPNERRRMILMVLAASVAWAFVGWKFYLQSQDDGYRELALAEIYQNCVDGGFKPKWVCDDDAEFAETFQRRQGIPLLLKADAQDTMVGLSYLQGITDQTTTMLARVEGQPILVFVDKLQRDTRPEEPSWLSGLNLFRQELDGLVLYEVTPLDEPRVLSNFYVPEQVAPSRGDAAPAAE